MVRGTTIDGPTCPGSVPPSSASRYAVTCQSPARTDANSPERFHESLIDHASVVGMILTGCSVAGSTTNGTLIDPSRRVGMLWTNGSKGINCFSFSQDANNLCKHGLSQSRATTVNNVLVISEAGRAGDPGRQSCLLKRFSQPRICQRRAGFTPMTNRCGTMKSLISSRFFM